MPDVLFCPCFDLTRTRKTGSAGQEPITALSYRSACFFALVCYSPLLYLYFIFNIYKPFLPPTISVLHLSNTHLHCRLPPLPQPSPLSTLTTRSTIYHTLSTPNKDVPLRLRSPQQLLRPQLLCPSPLPPPISPIPAHNNQPPAQKKALLRPSLPTTTLILIFIPRNKLRPRITILKLPRLPRTAPNTHTINSDPTPTQDQDRLGYEPTHSSADDPAAPITHLSIQHGCNGKVGAASGV